MKCFGFIGLFLVLGMGFVFGGSVRSGKAEVELFAKHFVVEAGGETVVAVRLRPDKGWHSYWKNPGEMGMPTSVAWEVPEGVTVDELEYPAPHLFMSSGIKSLGYEGEVVLLAKLKVGANVKLGRISVQAKVAWLTCTADACVPGNGEVSVAFEVGSEAKLSDADGMIVKAGEAMPAAVEGLKAGHTVSDKQFVLTLTLPEELEVGDADLYVFAENLVSVGEKVKWLRKGDKLVGEVGVSEYFEKVPEQVEVVLRGGALKRAVVVVSDLMK